MNKKLKLKTYISKRDLRRSREPDPQSYDREKGQLEFVIQKHAASRLHYDFRLEVDGVLKSWAVPKGPSLDPHVKRLAMMVEDHPFGYKDFEGIIPEGYGKGTVLIWDKGVYSVAGHGFHESQELMRRGLEKGEVHFFLEGKKVKGEFVLVKLKQKKNEWLLIKVKDRFISNEEITQEERSVISERTIEELGGPRISRSAVEKAPLAKKPHAITPMLAQLAEAAFDSKEWIFELKMDGFRAIAELKGSEVVLYSRNLKSFNERFLLIVNDLKRLNLDAILDGEIVSLDEKGISRFQQLQNQSSDVDASTYYYAFDILFLNGKDLRQLPLLERKAILKEVLKKESHIIYLDHVENKGRSLLRLAQQAGCEGIIGKKKESLYLTGVRSRNWVKIKAYQRIEATICGFTEPKRGRKNFGALIVGFYKKGKLHYIGHVGTGFSESMLKTIKNQLAQHIRKESPFVQTPKTNTPVTWVDPHYVCELKFSEFTKEGIMRHPVFLGLREDKSPKQAVLEQPVKVEKVKDHADDEKLDFLTHLDKVYFPKDNIAKGDVLAYYAEMGGLILPYLKDRPQSLKRFPDGISAESFFQKNMEHPPSWLTTIPIEHSDKLVNYLLIQDMKSLLYAVNLGCIELHPWFSRYQALDYPDFFVFDLDPEAISFDSVVETALALHEVLDSIGVTSLCKTTGASGLHICSPLQNRYTYEQAKQFALLIANYVHQQMPTITSLERSPKKRQKKVYIDCMQNNLAQTIVAPYSLRARDGIPVATPLDWREVKIGIDPLDYNYFNIKKRVKKQGDLFKPLLEKGIDMKKALKKIEKLLR